MHFCSFPQSIFHIIFEKSSLKIQFDELDFCSSSYWIFIACVAFKSQIQTRQKNQFIKLKYSKIKWRSIGGLTALIINLLIQACRPWVCRGCHDTPRSWQISTKGHRLWPPNQTGSTGTPEFSDLLTAL